ncbi:MAG: hypothetical protein SFV21_10945 [Rhodospirillaceae bacterium]|nr:hypothetical protein [Rhodospirillaceae bacterium]
MRPTIRLVLITALRDRLFLSLFALLVSALGGAIYLSGGAVFEQVETAAVYSAGSARAIIVLGLIIFVGFQVERMFDNREVEAILSRAISRDKFIFAYWAGLAVIGAMFVAPVAILLNWIAPDAVGSAMWAISLVFEVWLVLAFAVFAGFTFERAVPTVLATIGFYVLSRLMSVFTGIAAQGKQSGANQITNPVIDAIALALPRLDLFAQSHWLIYGPPSLTVIAVVAIQSAIFVPLLVLAAAFDLRRRQF